MNGGKLLLAALAAFVVMFLLSGFWHTYAMGDFYAEHTASPMRDEPLLWSVGLGYLVLALLMAWIFPKGYQGGSHLTEGIRFGAVIGVLVALPVGLVLYGVLEGATLTLVAVDTPWHIVEQGIGGAVLGLVYGRGGATEAASEGPAPSTGPQEPGPARPEPPRPEGPQPGPTGGREEGPL